jgi:hypothetical protein
MENTSPSMNQSSTGTGGVSSTENSMKPQTVDTKSLEVPSSTSSNTNSGELSSCEKETFEYEFSTTSHGQVMWMHLWDTNDKSACERILNRNLSGEQITYSQETGNGFVMDKWGNDFTFTKKPYKNSYVCTDLGTLETDLPPAGQQVTRVRAKKVMTDVMDILNSI